MNYSQVDYWKKYEPFFPAHLRASELGIAPEECQWAWKSYSIHVDRLEDLSSKAHIILVHGAGGYGRFLLPLGLACKERGYSTSALDLPGYGLTTPKDSSWRYEDWVACLSDFVDEESTRTKKPVVLFGLSLGGMLCYQTSAQNSNVKAVIVTTLADTRTSEVRRAMMKFGQLGELGLSLSGFLPKSVDSMMVPIGRLSKMNRMSGNSEFCDLVCNDKLGGDNWVPLGFLKTLCIRNPKSEPEQFQTPLLLAHPGNDTWTPTNLSKAFFDRLAGPKHFVELKNCGHAPIEEPGISTLENEVQQFLTDFL